MVLILSAKLSLFITHYSKKEASKLDIIYKQHLKCCANPSPSPCVDRLSRRNALVWSASFVTIVDLHCIATPWKVLAEDEPGEQSEKDGGVLGAIKSLFDTNEKTKSGKVLPKAYLKSAREVVKTLRESLREDPKDIAKFRRSADAAKESIREYLGSWKGQEKVVGEESYVELEKAFRSLANFYSKAGPSAPLPEDVKSEILGELNAAEEYL